MTKNTESDRNQTKTTINLSMQQYQILVDNAGESIFVSQDERFKYINPKGLEMIGDSFEELTSKPWYEFAHPNDQPLLIERYRQRIKGVEVPSKYEIRFVRKPGEIRWAKLNVCLIEWEEKPAILCLMTDFTDQKESEKKIALFARIFEDSLNEIYLFKTDTLHFVQVNNTAQRNLGYTFE